MRRMCTRDDAEKKAVVAGVVGGEVREKRRFRALRHANWRLAVLVNAHEQSVFVARQFVFASVPSCRARSSSLNVGVLAVFVAVDDALLV
jgi:hypothetical protein